MKNLSHVSVSLRFLYAPAGRDRSGEGKNIPVVSGTVVAIGAAKDRASLDPAGGQQWVSTVPCEKTKLVAGGPAVTGTEGKIRLSTV